MKKIILIKGMVLFFFIFSFEMDKSHSQVSFTASHLLITEVTGTFDEFDFKVNLDKKNKIKKITGIIKVETIDTKHQKRDQHLLSPDFFELSKYPEIKFESLTYQGNEYSGKLTGYLTIKDTKRKIILNVKKSKPVDFKGKKIISITLTTNLDRKEYNVGKKIPSGIVGNEIATKVILEIAQ